jgi:hypothetical protein
VTHKSISIFELNERIIDDRFLKSIYVEVEENKAKEIKDVKDSVRPHPRSEPSQVVILYLNSAVAASMSIELWRVVRASEAVMKMNLRN